MKKITSYLFFISVIGLQSLSAQDIVDINLDTKHAVDGVSEFDREKYILLHAGLDDNEWPNEAYKQDVLENYDIYLGRNNGSLPWIYNNVKQDPNKSGWPSIDHLQTEGQKNINNYISNVSEHKYENRLARYMMGGTRRNVS
ncbi:hypothetical protein Q4595_12175 [Wenyingzhuangia sp. 1_MG-2023]|nr:hypothetical protein [Wenyingzhuangia sp. 1_MG-2023]